jgi:small subunit ribosomal protein S17
MAEEPTNENPEETPDAAATPDAPETADAPETPDAPEAAAAAEEPETPEAPEAQAGTSAPPQAATAQSAPAEILAPKERRRRARAAKAAKVPARPARTPEERHAERVAERARKAKVRSAGRIRMRAKQRANKTPAEPIAAREHPAGTQKVQQGVVVSDAADKTITVRIDTTRRHRRYSKVVRTSSKVHAHDEANDANTGDTVVVREARPLSATKRWRLVQVVERAK